MRKIGVVLLFLSGIAFGQVSLSSQQLNFGDVFTNSNKEMGVDVSNISSQKVTITDVKCYNSYGEFEVKALPISTIEPSESVKFRVTFKPKHNLAYNSELIFSLDNGNMFRIDLLGNGRYTDSYYDATFNKSYQDLKDELKSIISANYVNYGYNGARDKMYGDIDNVSGQVTCVYTGRVATFNTRSGANSVNFNCEHTWPQSLFNQNEPERADMHHLFSTDINANGQRGNLPFGIVSNASWSEGGSKLGNGVFEPRDEQKGATARAMLYFVLRYQDYSNFIDNQEATLINWHNTFEPNAIEIARNERIYFYQKNRNPFVDHPEFAERINKFGATDTKPVIKKVNIIASQFSFGSLNSSDERTIYITNTGNEEITTFSSSTLNQVCTIKSAETSILPGEVAKIVLQFTGLSDGTYYDTLAIDATAQTGEYLKLPIQFSVGLNSVQSKATKLLKVHYNANTKQIQLIDAPMGLNEVQVYTLNGKRVFNEISTSFTDIPTNGFVPGVYFVVVNSEMDVYSTKVLIY